MTDAFRPHSLGEAMHGLGRLWAVMLALGALFAFLGFVALILVVSATIASVVLIGIFMAIAGGMEIVIGFNSKTWGRFFLWVAAGLLYLIAGAIAIAQPLMAATVFTLLLGILLLATGAVRLWVAAHLPAGRRGLPIVSGLVTLALGVVIVLGWPANSVFVLGLLLGIDLIIYGTNWIAFALALRALEHRRTV
jgi:uncharacterized membrane protein HdeD (DUF308 family)